MTTSYIYFIIFACLAYLIITDSSIAKLVVFATRLAKFQYEKAKWWLWINPKTPWAKYVMWRRSLQLAKELQEEFDKRR